MSARPSPLISAAAIRFHSVPIGPSQLRSLYLCAVHQQNGHHSIARTLEQDVSGAVAVQIGNGCKSPIVANCSEQMRWDNLETVHGIKRDHAIAFATEQDVGPTVGIEVADAGELPV